MPSSINFVEHIAETINGVGLVSYTKMFGEYLIYCNRKPIILVCDDTAYVKILPETTAILGEDWPTQSPYAGAKPYYTIDPDNPPMLIDLARALERVIPLPKPKK